MTKCTRKNIASMGGSRGPRNISGKRWKDKDWNKWKSWKGKRKKSPQSKKPWKSQKNPSIFKGLFENEILSTVKKKMYIEFQPNSLSNTSIHYYFKWS